MKLGFRQIITIVAALLPAINMPAQDIPVLPKDPAVMDGILPNGMAFYLVTNPVERGFADFALVQRTGLLTPQDSTGAKTIKVAEGALDSLKRMRPASPLKFLRRHEVNQSKCAFVKVSDDATTFHFHDVNLVTTSVDSVLLLVMDIVDRVNDTEDGFMKKWYSPSDHAVIVSGDINAASIASKLASMSFMVPAGPSAPRPEYSCNAFGESIIVEEVPGKPSLSRISATWTAKRTPRQYMNTVQSEILEMSLNTLGTAAVNRLKKSFRTADVPIADVSYSHVCSSTYPYDDSITITVVLETANAGKVPAAISEVMASIDAFGLGIHEYRVAEATYNHELIAAVGRPFTENADYIERCRHAFLYNSTLASPRERLAFHTSRNLPDTMRQRLFNDIAKAFIDTVMIPSVPLPYEDVFIPDSLDCTVDPMKLKLKSTKREPVSGGSVWTFSNGFKVIFRHTPSDRIHYGLAMNGGYGGVTQLEPGEGAFLSDYFSTCRVAGMNAEDFLNVLSLNGVTMDVAVNMSNTVVGGSLPKEKMPLLLHALLAVTNDRVQDEDAFKYYKKSEYLALDNAEGSFYARMTAVDSIICPGYKYSSYKTKGKLSRDFSGKAEAFYRNQFSKTNDGALILVGNLNEENLKKMLLAHVGGFKTSKEVSRKPTVHYQAVSGTSTYTVDGQMDNVDVVISSRLPVTLDNYIAAELAVMVLERRLANVLEGSGMKLSMVHECWVYPEERMNILISLSQDSDGGYAAGLNRKTPIEALADVRSVLSGLHGIEVSNDMLNVMKNMLKHKVAVEMNSPDYWVEAIKLRYLIGKDLSTGYAPRIDAITPDRVRSVLSALEDGSCVEYVTTKK